MAQTRKALPYLAPLMRRPATCADGQAALTIEFAAPSLAGAAHTGSWKPIFSPRQRADRESLVRHRWRGLNQMRGK